MPQSSFITKTGLGVEQDIEKALELYDQSGKQGHTSAHIRLGYLYQFGLTSLAGNFIYFHVPIELNLRSDSYRIRAGYHSSAADKAGFG